MTTDLAWTDSEDQGVKFFSGTATYRTKFMAPAIRRGQGKRWMLHFDDVRDMAKAKLNGQPVGFVWAPPYDIDVTDMLKPGTNSLEIAVTNEWTNRIAGDRNLPEDRKILHDVPPTRFGPATQQLPPSGILGHVSLIKELPRTQK
jgi:hypothetical protein